MAGTMQMAEPEAGICPEFRLVSTVPGAGASDGSSHGMETLEQKSVPTHPPGGSRGRSQDSVEGLGSTQIFTEPLVFHSCILLLWGSAVHLNYSLSPKSLAFKYLHWCTGEAVNIHWANSLKIFSRKQKQNLVNYCIFSHHSLST